jgi:drug/metabolite transporter (DMT)-like permease
VALVITKKLLEEAGPFTISLLRFLLAWVLLAPFASRQGYRLSLTLRPAFVLFGVTGVTLYFGLLNVGLLFTGAGSAALLQAGIPAITTLLSVLFLKERVSRLQLLGISLSVAGLLLVMGNSVEKGGSSPLLGNLLIAGNVLAWAIYTVQGKHLSSAFPWLVVTTASIGVGVICLLPFALGEVWWQGLPHLHGDGLLQLLYLGGASSALGAWAVELWPAVHGCQSGRSLLQPHSGRGPALERAGAA